MLKWTFYWININRNGIKVQLLYFAGCLSVRLYWGRVTDTVVCCAWRLKQLLKGFISDVKTTGSTFALWGFRWMRKWGNGEERLSWEAALYASSKKQRHQKKNKNAVFDSSLGSATWLISAPHLGNHCFCEQTANTMSLTTIEMENDSVSLKANKLAQAICSPCRPTERYF